MRELRERAWAAGGSHGGPLAAALFAAALIAASPGPGEAQAPRMKGKLLMPTPGATAGWGREAPTPALSARLERDPGVAEPTRLFMTANVSQAGRIVDGVRLYDDGTHGDPRAGDRVFTADYRPPRLGEYSVQVRAQVELPGIARSREAWSEPVTVFVEPIPYPRIVVPEPAGRVGRGVAVRARLLLGDQPFTQADPTLHAEVSTDEPKGNDGTRAGEGGSGRHPDRMTAERNGSLVTPPVTFQRLGKRAVWVNVSVERRGARLQAFDGPVYVQVANPPVLLFWIVGAPFPLALLLPRRPSIPV